MPYWQLYYHITWATLNRQPLLMAEFEVELHQFLSGKAADLGLTVYAVNSMPDHVHLAVSIPPDRTVADCIGKLKGSSSHMINQHYPATPVKWQRGYGVVTFREEKLTEVVTYIQKQKAHHATKNTLSGFEQTDQ